MGRLHIMHLSQEIGFLLKPLRGSLSIISNKHQLVGFWKLPDKQNRLFFEPAVFLVTEKGFEPRPSVMSLELPSAPLRRFIFYTLSYHA